MPNESTGLEARMKSQGIFTPAKSKGFPPEILKSNSESAYAKYALGKISKEEYEKQVSKRAGFSFDSSDKKCSGDGAIDKWINKLLHAMRSRYDGGPGSGNFGHGGRPGEVGGSAPGNGSRPVVHGKDITGSYKGENSTRAIIKAQGFDGLPKRVGKKEFDAAVKESHFIAQRTYSASSQEILDAYRDQLYNGEFYVDCTEGGSQYGQGMYCAADYEGNLTDGIREEMDHYKSLYQSELTHSEAVGIAKEKIADQVRTQAKQNFVEKFHPYIDGYDFEQGKWSPEFVDQAKQLKAENPGLYDKVFAQLKSYEEKYDSSVEWAEKASTEDIGFRYKFSTRNEMISNTETLTLDPSAKIISYGDLDKRFQEYQAEHSYEGSKQKAAKEVISGYASTTKERNEITKMWKLYNTATTQKQWDQLETLQEKYPSINLIEVDAAVQDKIKESRKSIITDRGAFAAALGYDAINAEGHGSSGSYTVVLNRTKVIFLDESLKEDAKGENTIHFQMGPDGVIYAIRDKKVIGWVATHETTSRQNADGGPGSGNWGHEGRPGYVGGSKEGTGGVENRITQERNGETRYTSHAKIKKKVSTDHLISKKESKYICMPGAMFILSGGQKLVYNQDEGGFVEEGHSIVWYDNEIAGWHVQKVILPNKPTKAVEQSAESEISESDIEEAVALLAEEEFLASVSPSTKIDTHNFNPFEKGKTITDSNVWALCQDGASFTDEDGEQWKYYKEYGAFINQSTGEIIDTSDVAGKMGLTSASIDIEKPHYSTAYEMNALSIPGASYYDESLDMHAEYDEAHGAFKYEDGDYYRPEDIAGSKISQVKVPDTGNTATAGKVSLYTAESDDSYEVDEDFADNCFQDGSTFKSEGKTYSVKDYETIVDSEGYEYYPSYFVGAEIQDFTIDPSKGHNVSEGELAELMQPGGSFSLDSSTYEWDEGAQLFVNPEASVTDHDWIYPENLLYTYVDSATLPGAEKAAQNAQSTGSPIASTNGFISESQVAELRGKFDNAHNPETSKDADDLYRKQAGEVWRSLDDDQKDALYKYTDGYYNTINSPLHGEDSNPDNKTIDWINGITESLDRSEIDSDRVLFRGISTRTFGKIFGIDSEELESGDLSSLVGLTGKDDGFGSCGSHLHGVGFTSKDVHLHICAPEGTKALYAEPFSAHGEGDKKLWDGKSTQKYFGGELETLLQRGTSYAILDARKETVEWHEKLVVDVAIIGQDYSDISFEEKPLF